MKPVSHIASSSSRPPTLSQWNLKIEFYSSFDRCHKGNRLYRAGLRADSNSDILIACPPRCFDNYFNSRVYTRSRFNDDCGSDRYITCRGKCLVLFSNIKYTFSNYSRQKEIRVKKTWHHPRSLRSKLVKPAL